MGWGPVLAQVLKLDFDVAIPSTGPTITRAELEAFKAKIDTMVARATGLVKQGRPERSVDGPAQDRRSRLAAELHRRPARQFLRRIIGRSSRTHEAR